MESTAELKPTEFSDRKLTNTEIKQFINKYMIDVPARHKYAWSRVMKKARKKRYGR
jgi:hypothetical protein